jgi:hypothetical protein
LTSEAHIYIIQVVERQQPRRNEMPKIKYQAVFADGEVKNRSSDRVYVAAYKAMIEYEGGKSYRYGFSSSKELARKAAGSEISARSWKQIGSSIEVVDAVVI